MIDAQAINHTVKGIVALIETPETAVLLSRDEDIIGCEAIA